MSKDKDGRGGNNQNETKDDKKVIALQRNLLRRKGKLSAGTRTITKNNKSTPI